MLRSIQRQLVTWRGWNGCLETIAEEGTKEFSRKLLLGSCSLLGRSASSAPSYSTSTRLCRVAEKGGAAARNTWEWEQIREEQRQQVEKLVFAAWRRQQEGVVVNVDIDKHYVWQRLGKDCFEKQAEVQRQQVDVLKAESVKRKRRSKMNKHKHRKRKKRASRKKRKI